MEKLYIIGLGPGDETNLTEKAKNTLKTVKRAINTRETPLPELTSELKKNQKGPTAVLVSGDASFYSAAKTIIKENESQYEIELIPGISSIQYFCAKIKTPYDDAVIISMHGRNENIIAKTAYNKKILALTGGKNNVGEICQTLSRSGLGEVTVTVGERLSYPDEKITTGTAEKMKEMEFDALSVICIENNAAVNPHTPLKDAEFIRAGIPMTKEEVRWLSIQKLGINPQDTVYDIGAGTGAVSVEIARKAFDGFVYAIETKEAACALIRKNAEKHGAFNMEIIKGKAPGALENLPTPDKAFIGGSSGNMNEILEKLLSQNPKIKIAATAVTLQTLSQITERFGKNGITDTEIICVNIAKTKKTGAYDMMTAQNPVYIITATP